MVRRAKIWIGILGGLLACAPARGADPGANPYLGIVERNVFHLNPPPAPPDPEANKPPPPKIYLTGISTFMGVRRALLKTGPVAKPGEPAKEQSYMLAEHERKDELEVLAIDENEGSVKVNYSGTEITVNFKDNAVASTAPAAPPGGMPTLPAAPHAPPVPNAAFPGRPGPGMNPGGPSQFPQRPVRGNGTFPGRPGAAGAPPVRLIAGWA